MEQSVGAGGASGYGRPYPCPSRPGPRGVGVRDSPFSTSRQPDRDSRPPMPTDSRPCFMSAGGRAFARVPGPARPRSPHYRCPPADCVSAVSRDTNPVCQSQCPHHSRRETAHAPRAQLTAEEGSVPSGVPLRQGHLVLHLVQDGGQDTAEGSGAVLSRGAGSEAGLADRGPSSPSPAAPSTLFSKLYLLRSRDSVARRSPCVRAPCRDGSVTHCPRPALPSSAAPAPLAHQAFQPLGNDGGEPALPRQLRDQEDVFGR